MQFQILGPLEMTSSGQPVDLGARKQRMLLALLLINANRVVSTDRILESLWGDDAEGKENALWVYVSRLRGVLEPERGKGEQGEVLVTRDHGYQLNVDPDAIDAARFERAAAEGRSLVRDDPERAAGLLATALEEWSGIPLQEFAYEEFAQSELARLEELRVTALEDRIEADLRRGAARDVIADLEALHDQYPLRERPVGQLMLALYRSGRQADALRTFTRYERHLAEELGVEASPELRRLEEQILLHDSRIQASRPTRVAAAHVARAVNPYKGLRAFGEDDASDFYGRERLIADLMRRMGEGQQMLALVGASGSGKSSVVKAGLIPAIRKSDDPGRQSWIVAQMVPGSHPFTELEVALLRSTLDGPESLAEQIRVPDTGILGACLRVLPDPDSRLLLVIDQFEELFTLAEDEAVRRDFLAGLVTAVDDPHGRITVVLTLRADFYHRPLTNPDFGDRLGEAVVNVVPLRPDELETAALKPAQHMGMELEPALLGALIGDVAGQPGALPLYQYALTELFDRRVGNTLTLDAYRASGGVAGALSTRAEDLYARLTVSQRTAAKQLFLRLVTIAETDEWSRRRVPAREILALDLDVLALQAAIDLYAGHRLLTLDRDSTTGSPTVEVGHEALLNEWERLRDWIDAARDDVRRHAALTTSMFEWWESARDPGFLLTGSRLEAYEQWAGQATMQLTKGEREFLAASVEARDTAVEFELERQQLELRAVRSARRRLWGLGALIIAVAGLAVVVLALAPWSTKPVVTAMLRSVDGGGQDAQNMFVRGLESAERDFGIELAVETGPFVDLPAEYDVAVRDTDLFIGSLDTMRSWWPGWTDAEAQRLLAQDSPGTSRAYLGFQTLVPDAASVRLSAHEGAYLAGAAAALNSQSNVIAFIGPVQVEDIESFRAGYEQGARHARPGVRVLSQYVTTTDSEDAAFMPLSPDRWPTTAQAARTADFLIAEGADVVFWVGGVDGGMGVLEAVARANEDAHRVWFIGTDVNWGLERVNGQRAISHVLTSVVTRWDAVAYNLVDAYTSGELSPGPVEYGVAAGVIELTATGGHLADVRATLAEIGSRIATGATQVDRVPDSVVSAPVDAGVVSDARVRFDGTVCEYEGPLEVVAGNTLRLTYENDASVPSSLRLRVSALQSIPAESGRRNVGYLRVNGSNRSISCTTAARMVPGPSLELVNHPATAIDHVVQVVYDGSQCTLLDGQEVRVGSLVEFDVANRSSKFASFPVWHAADGSSDLLSEPGGRFIGDTFLAHMDRYYTEGLASRGTSVRFVARIDTAGEHFVTCFSGDEPGNAAFVATD